MARVVQHPIFTMAIQIPVRSLQASNSIPPTCDSQKLLFRGIMSFDSAGKILILNSRSGKPFFQPEGHIPSMFLSMVGGGQGQKVGGAMMSP